MRPGDLLGRRKLSVARATLKHMEVTEKDIARIPVRNLRVPRDDFVAVWIEAQRLCRDNGQRGVSDWYPAGVATTCSWLAGAIVRASSGQRYPAYSPVTRRTATAYEELIEAEYLAAELLDVRRPELVQSRPGWCEGIRATLRWAWRRSGPAPLELPATVRPAG